ncbi:hypothetical protein SAMN05660772_02045 [Pasteurella testudinis DSM 23072]|uniref:Uncharacterized protein n=1 Tax=Pasteurella testudinis DSM 23072 TaxID=1122938 RepID=A0A1W1UMI0_9PAST|nr:hypothetical protein [Pasteurella testudinis]SMB82306.1 hypothetical protein SAMN05660772_02045 [Pasteurella testudinis DSM 23072]SUB51483.1 Uncharacterised protein [Pasteurella testudinis]
MQDQKITDFPFYLRMLAYEYRVTYADLHPIMLEKGYIRIYQGKAYGWCAEMCEAHTERPFTLLVGINGEIYEATGGSDQKGAKTWQLIQEKNNENDKQIDELYYSIRNKISHKIFNG